MSKTWIGEWEILACDYVVPLSRRPGRCQSTRSIMEVTCEPWSRMMTASMMRYGTGCKIPQTCLGTYCTARFEILDTRCRLCMDESIVSGISDVQGQGQVHNWIAWTPNQSRRDVELIQNAWAVIWSRPPACESCE